LREVFAELDLAPGPAKTASAGERGRQQVGR